MNLNEWRLQRAESGDLRQSLASAKETALTARQQLIKDLAKEITETKRLADLIEESANED